MLTACQVRMARAALGLTLHQLADLSGVSEKTIRRIEGSIGFPPVSKETSDRIRAVFEKNGCTFTIDTKAEWASVRIDKGAESLVQENLGRCFGPEVND